MGVSKLMREPAEAKKIRADAMLSFTNLPSVFYLYTTETLGKAKYKYLVILSADRSVAYYFMINSMRYWAGDGEIHVTPDDIPCLIRDSWINCRILFEIPREELVERMAENIDTYDRGLISDKVIRRIVDAVTTSKTLTEEEIEIVLKALAQN